MADPRGGPDARSGLRRLMEQSRPEGAQGDRFHATMGSGWQAWAEQLEQALALAVAALPPQPEQEDVFPAVEDVLAKHCRGFMDRPTTRSNIADLIDRICVTHERCVQEKQEAEKALRRLGAALPPHREDRGFVSRLLTQFRQSEHDCRASAKRRTVSQLSEHAVDVARAEVWELAARCLENAIVRDAADLHAAPHREDAADLKRVLDAAQAHLTNGLAWEGPSGEAYFETRLGLAQNRDRLQEAIQRLSPRRAPQAPDEV